MDNDYEDNAFDMSTNAAYLKESDLMYKNGISKIPNNTESEEVETNETENTAIPSEVNIEETSIFLYNLEDVELDQNTQVPIPYSTTKLLTVTDILIFSGFAFISFTFSYVS